MSEQNIVLLEHQDKKIYLVGTAHVSKASAELVEQLIRTHRPQTVCLELCEGRYHSIRNPKTWQDTDIVQVIRSGRAYVLLAQLVLAAFQRKLARKLNVEPGAEMHAAVKVADEIGATILPVDRDIRVTLKRAWRKLSFWSLAKLCTSLSCSLFSSEEVSEAEVEQLKTGDALVAIMAEFTAHLPALKDVLIDERDTYMATKLLQAHGSPVVAVVGAGHAAGICQVFGAPADLASLEEIPPSHLFTRVLTWALPLSIIGMIAWGFFRSGAQTSADMAVAWIVASGSLAALGALVSLAHPLTILTAFVVAPLTTLHPLLAAGWFCGLAEAWLRKPRVRDFETIAEDIVSIKGIWKNRLGKILLVIVMANIGAAAGALIGLGKIVTLM